MLIRAVAPADLASLRSLYHDVVQVLGPSAYSAGQVAAWSTFAAQAVFARFVFEVHTFVAVDDGRVTGFCGVADDGHVASLYVHSRCLRQGVGSRLLAHALGAHPSPSSGRFYAEASLFSLPLFEQFGFDLVATERSERNGEVFDRFLVEKAVTTVRGEAPQ